MISARWRVHSTSAASAVKPEIPAATWIGQAATARIGAAASCAGDDSAGARSRQATIAAAMFSSMAAFVATCAS